METPRCLLSPFFARIIKIQNGLLIGVTVEHAGWPHIKSQCPSDVEKNRNPYTVVTIQPKREEEEASAGCIAHMYADHKLV